MLNDLAEEGVEIVGDRAAPAGARVLVASRGELRDAAERGNVAVYMDHGAGQPYAELGTPEGADVVTLALAPGPLGLARNHRWFEKARHEMIGCPALDTAPCRGLRTGCLRIAVSFRADIFDWCPEAGGAWKDLHPVVPMLMGAGFTVMGHGHPRAMGMLVPWYRSLGVDVYSYEEVLAHADLLVVDNSSVAPEFAALTHAPICWMDSPRYRRDVTHGGRFWDWRNGIPGFGSMGEALSAVREALENRPGAAKARRAMVDDAYAAVDGQATDRAVEAILEWLAY